MLYSCTKENTKFLKEKRKKNELNSQQYPKGSSRPDFPKSGEQKQ